MTGRAGCDRGPQRDRSLSFGSEATAWPPVVSAGGDDWLLPPGARDVLDLGAGTGKLTTRLVERRLDVVAVDPIAEMPRTAQFGPARHPGTAGHRRADSPAGRQRRRGAGGAAWHWFDPERAVAEVARVLRRAGGSGWCGTPATNAWAGSMTWAASSVMRTTPSPQEVSLPEPFTDVARRHVGVDDVIYAQALIDLVASRSSASPPPAEVRTRTLDQVRELLATIPRWPTPTDSRCPTSRCASGRRSAPGPGAQRVDGRGDVDHHHGHGGHAGEVDSAGEGRPVPRTATAGRRPPPAPMPISGELFSPPKARRRQQKTEALKMGRCCRTTRRTKATASSRSAGRGAAPERCTRLRPVRRRCSRKARVSTRVG